jgi:hypothetical protein
MTTTRYIDVVGDDYAPDPFIDRFEWWFANGAIAVVEVGAAGDHVLLEARIAGSRSPRFFQLDEDGFRELSRDDEEDDL